MPSPAPRKRSPAGQAPTPSPALEAPERIRWAVAELRLRNVDSVLEVGCGAGHALSLIAAKVTRGSVTGIDRSAAQVATARARHRAAIRAGSLRIERMSLDEAPAALPEPFSKVLAINVNAFWTTPDSSLSSAQRLLGPRGQLYLAFEPPSPNRARALLTLLPALLGERDWRVVRVASATLSRSHALCVVARPR